MVVDPAEYARKAYSYESTGMGRYNGIVKVVLMKINVLEWTYEAEEVRGEALIQLHQWDILPWFIRQGSGAVSFLKVYLMFA